MKKSFILMLSAILTVGMLGCGNSQESKKTSTEPATTTNTEKDKKQDTVTIDGKEIPKIIEGNKVLVDNDKCTITYTGVDNGHATGALVKLAVENKTDKKIIVQVRDVSLQNEMINTVCSIEVTPGKQSSKDGITIIGSALDNGSTLKMEGTFSISIDTDFAHATKEQFSFEI